MAPSARRSPCVGIAVGTFGTLVGAGGGFVLMTIVGTITHLVDGDLVGLEKQTVLIGLGAVVGAQLGARLSTRVRGLLIIRALAGVLAFVGLRLGAQSLLGR